ncbi:MAG: molecular chaperone DnaJ [Bacteroidia bacterium]|jgi:DnaJ-class molecular chaperone|nr:molecular chaperone DnaJ [Bacteroidia bacterium]
MNNPYEILKVNQDANKGEIMKAQMLAMKEKKYSLQEIAVAVRQLLDPAKRLAADYMFPTKIKSKRIQKIAVEIPVEKIDLNDIDENTFDSLK